MPSNGTFFWRKCCGHERVGWWHFLNCRGWENEGSLFLGELTMVHKSSKSAIVSGIGKAMLGLRSIGVHTTTVQSNTS